MNLALSIFIYLAGAKGDNKCNHSFKTFFKRSNVNFTMEALRIDPIPVSSVPCVLNAIKWIKEFYPIGDLGVSPISTSLSDIN